MTTAQNIDHTGNDSVRGCLQAYARSSHTRIWVPMGIQYRKLLSCRHPRQRRYKPPDIWLQIRFFYDYVYVQKGA